MNAGVFALLVFLAPAATAQTPAEQPVKPGDGVSAPTVVSEVKPSYSPLAIANRLEGDVTLEAVVEKDGSVGEVRVLKPVHATLDEAAIAALKQWKFKPGMRDGTPVRVVVEVEMTFRVGDVGPRVDSPDVFKRGPGIAFPAVLKEVKPNYTAAARDARVEGTVMLDCVVLPDGKVGDVRITKKLDPGLDAEAVLALKQWRFVPGKKDGAPVPVQVTVELTFTLK